MPMKVEGLGDLSIHMILSKLSPKDVALVGCVSPRLKIWASDDPLWSKFCSDDLNLSSPVDPFGNLKPSFKEAYETWRKAFGSHPWHLVKRVKRCWDTLRGWLDKNFPEVAATLQGGATEAEIAELESSLEVKLPLPTKLLYRFCNGQAITSRGTTCDSPLGLIGGYSFYDHVVNVYLLPLSEIMLETKRFMLHMGFPSGSEFIIVAASSTHMKKVFFLNCTDGQLYVSTRYLAVDEEMLPCVPTASISLAPDSKGDTQQDAMLLWLEEHGRRLQNGIIKAREENNVKSIDLFPEVPPLCPLAVTHGVQVRASAVLVPELSDLQADSKKYIFAYSVRMCLLPGGCDINGLKFNSCQLYSRHWIIRANDTVVSNVNAEAVIGKFPLLLPGEGEFVYQSCTPLQSSQGSVEGCFTFVPGSLYDQKGGPFEAIVAKFPLQVPQYIF